MTATNPSDDTAPATDDTAAVDVQLPAGTLTAAQLQTLADLAHTHAGGVLHLTPHAHLRLHGNPAPLTTAVTDAGFTVGHPALPRLLASPLSGRIGGLRDIRSLTDTALTRLPTARPGVILGLDDGTGDIVALTPDRALLALPGDEWALLLGGEDTGIRRTAPAGAVDLLFDDTTSTGTTRTDTARTDTARTDTTATPTVVPPPPTPPIGWLDQPDGTVTLAGGLPGGVLPARLAEFLAAVERPLVVTPWRSVLLCDLDEQIAEQIVRVLAPMGLIFDAQSPHLR
ncbi:precorrin-3B synthase [Rhodococcus artemisiae]|uniref:Precorrin-3B synthase n=1 Tax=Rhodococcus artemisiae TaxID=714159 RepID=A0ABU7LK03_9NOCA|nr:precorrin-3B synthase [Rhodococcus artemisiae]MEE2061879.1 precorrin-3B synthase [Rhodococcus artemisiae]